MMASRGVPAMALRIDVARGCVGAAAAVIACTMQTADGRPADGFEVTPAELAVTRPDEQLCAAVPPTPFRVEDRRSFQHNPVAASTHRRNENAAGNASIPCSLPSSLDATSYSSAAAQLLSLRCAMRALPAGSSAGAAQPANGTTLAQLSSRVLAPAIAVAVPSDILVYKPLTGELQSMRSPSSVVRLQDGLDVERDDGHAASVAIAAAAETLAASAATLQASSTVSSFTVNGACIAESEPVRALSLTERLPCTSPQSGCGCGSAPAIPIKRRCKCKC